MVKAAECVDKLIFDYLGKERTAVFLSYTQCFLENDVNCGNLWVQYDEKGSITAVLSVCQEGKTLLFSNESTDYEELSVIINGIVISPDKLPFSQIDKKYLLHISTQPHSQGKGVKYTRFGEIKGLNGELLPDYAEDISHKMYLNLKGRCEGALIEENGEIISGGFISFNEETAVISDVFTKREYRNRGNGTAIVKNLLMISPCENVYLVCEEHNLKFYENIGFKKAMEIYEYKSKG
ncbi:MAG: GNAT family N-acetyltransferase [Candidatus Fimenecus sp.]